MDEAIQSAREMGGDLGDVLRVLSLEGAQDDAAGSLETIGERSFLFRFDPAEIDALSAAYPAEEAYLRMKGGVLCWAVNDLGLSAMGDQADFEQTREAAKKYLRGS